MGVQQGGQLFRVTVIVVVMEKAKESDASDSDEPAVQYVPAAATCTATYSSPEFPWSWHCCYWCSQEQSNDAAMNIQQGRVCVYSMTSCGNVHNNYCAN